MEEMHLPPCTEDAMLVFECFRLDVLSQRMGVW